MRASFLSEGWELKLLGRDVISNPNAVLQGRYEAAADQAYNLVPAPICSCELIFEAQPTSPGNSIG
jgi:hypothetical protein